ncbi:MAG: RNA 2',3'-cyclic phosphodiesterase [Bryobacteraceae bacterium]
MRLFTALDLSPEVLLRMERLISRLRPEGLIQWSPLDNLHVTLKFIGEWPEARLDELDRRLRTLAPREPFEMEIRDLGWFPDKGAPRFLWAGVHGGSALAQLARDTEECLEALGIAKEQRPFSPHLTLARIKHPAPLGRLRREVQEQQSAAFGAFPVSQFTLFRSEPGSNASIYHRVREYRFQSAAAAS